MSIKKTMALIALYLVIALFTSACGGNLAAPASAPVSSAAEAGSSVSATGAPAPQPIAMGCYVETLIDAQGCDSVRAIAAHGDALYVAATKHGQPESYFFRYEGGRFYPLDYALDAQYDVEKMTIAPNGALSLLCTRTVPMEGKQQRATLSGEGAVKWLREYAVYALDGDTFTLRFTAEYIMRGAFTALDDERYLLGDNTAILTADSGGNRLSDLWINKYIFCAALEENTLYAVTENEQLGYAIARHEYPSGDKINEIAIEGTNTSTGNIALSGDGAGGAYIACAKGLYHLNAGGNKLELLLDGLSYAIGDTSGALSTLCVTAEGDMYALIDVFDGSGSHGELYRYAWSADAPVYAQRELTIASLNEHPMIKDAISRYMRAHKDVKVNYRTYLPMRHALNIDWYSLEDLAKARVQIEDAVRIVNTEVLSGNAPDIFVMDSMPLSAYIQKGYLDDMSSWAGTRPADGTWVPGVAAGYRQADGTLPCLATKFAVSSIWGDSAQIGAIKTLDDLVQAAVGRADGGHLFDTYSERSLLTTLFPICAAEWTGPNGKISFSVPQLSDFLNQIKTLQDALPEADDKEGSSLTANNLAAGLTDMMLLELGHRGSGEIPYSLIRFSGRRPAVRAMPALSERRAFMPELIVAVSAGSAHKDIAYDFLDLFLSEAFLEDLSYDYGYSVVASVCEKAVRTTVERYGGMEFAEVGGRSVKVGPMDEATVADVLSLLNAADTPITSDYALMTMIIEECMPYLRGEKSLESTVQSLHERTWAYLAE